MLKLLVLIATAGVVLGVPLNPQPNEPTVGIVGGNDAYINEHPYQLALLSHNTYFCGGVIISSLWGITAAHCFDFGTPFNLRVLGGSANRSSGGQIIDVEEVLRHPNYFADTRRYDAALMRFAYSFDVPNTRPVRLPELNHPVLENQIVIVTGWGAVQEGGDASEILQEVHVPVVEQDSCISIYGTFINDGSFCAGYLGEGGKDACQEDSGGPAVIDGVLVGLVSWGIGCARPEFPTVYTRVPAIMGWISEILNRPSLL